MKTFLVNELVHMTYKIVRDDTDEYLSYGRVNFALHLIPSGD